jgi:quinol monooxygenase YgiN
MDIKKTVIAKLAVSPETSEEFKQLVAEIVSKSKSEEGCLSYNVFQETINQSSTFVFWEEYLNDAALEQHNNSEHFKQFFIAATLMFSCEPVLIIK